MQQGQTNVILQAARDHLDQVLGAPVEQYFGAESIQIRLHSDAPFEHAVTLSTLGAVTHDPIRQEFVLSAWEDFLDEDLLTSFEAITLRIVQMHTALAAGSLIAGAGAIFSSAPFTTLYVTQPTYFPVEFSDIPLPSGFGQVRWLIPLYQAEAAWVRVHGDDAFENQLEALDPDLLDFGRPLLPFI